MRRYGSRCKTSNKAGSIACYPCARVFVISGPSGSGKTTLLEQSVKDRRLSKKLARSVSYTTRPKRSLEKEGRDYFFISEREFNKKLGEKKILEWTRYLNYYYATPRDKVEEALRENRSVLLCLDVKGALRVRRIFGKRTIMIFVMPPSLDILEHRIAGRCSRTCKKEIRERINIAREELRRSRLYDYVIVNDNLKRSAKELKAIIQSYLNKPRKRKVEDGLCAC